jgi:hypothetical protein
VPPGAFGWGEQKVDAASSGFEEPGLVKLKKAVAGLKMAHLPKIALACEFLSARPDGARA